MVPGFNHHVLSDKLLTMALLWLIVFWNNHERPWCFQEARTATIAWYITDLSVVNGSILHSFVLIMRHSALRRWIIKYISKKTRTKYNIKNFPNVYGEFDTFQQNLCIKNFSLFLFLFNFSILSLYVICFYWSVILYCDDIVKCLKWTKL